MELDLNGTLGLYSLGDEIDRFPAEFNSGRYSRTLLKSPRLRIVLVGMKAGTDLIEHTAPGPITIQPIRGRFTASVDGVEHPVALETVLAIDAEVRHSVRADEDGVFLLTILLVG